MNLYTALVAITAIVAITLISRYRFESKRPTGADTERLDRLEAELRERIETLERIVTDQREKLKRQIDDL